MKGLKFVFLLLAMGALTGCASAVDDGSPESIDVQQTGTAQVVQTAVGVVIAAGTPMPSWTPIPPTPLPTATPTSTPRPTATPTATPTPFGGEAGVWIKYDAEWKIVAELPQGVVPPSIHDWWGDPGYVYVRYVNGVDVETRDFPGYWPWVVVVPGAILLLLGLLVLGMYFGMKPMNSVALALSKSFAPSATQPALPPPEETATALVPFEEVIELLTRWSPGGANRFQRWLATIVNEKGGQQ